MAKKEERKLIANNKKARFDYFISPSKFATESSDIVYFPIVKGLTLLEDIAFINSDRSSPCNK